MLERKASRVLMPGLEPKASTSEKAIKMNNQMMCTEALINQQEEFKNDRTLFQQY